MIPSSGFEEGLAKEGRGRVTGPARNSKQMLTDTIGYQEEGEEGVIGYAGYSNSY